MSDMHYFLGCPVWSWADWKGSVYRPGAPKSQWLAQYSRKFNTVEGNTTFYGIPTIETAQKWCDQTPLGFRFSLKFPQSISHDKQLNHCEFETRALIKCLEVIRAADRLGPTFLQLSPNFDPNRFADLIRYLHQLPRDFPFAVEVRHPDFFKDPFEPRLNEALRNLNIDRVTFDTRPLFSRPARDESEKRARQRKPRVTVRQNATSRFPIVRLVGLNDIASVDPWIQEWAKIVADWIHEDRQPFVFTHTPDDTFAPLLAHRFHRELQSHCALPDLTPLETIETQKKLF